MKKWVVMGIALLSLAACAPYPYYYRDRYDDGYYGRPAYHGYYDRGYYDRDRDGYYRDERRY